MSVSKRSRSALREREAMGLVLLVIGCSGASSNPGKGTAFVAQRSAGPHSDASATSNAPKTSPIQMVGGDTEIAGNGPTAPPAAMIATNPVPQGSSRCRVPWHRPSHDVNGEGRNEVQYRGLTWSPYNEDPNLIPPTPDRATGPYWALPLARIVGDLDRDGYADMWSVEKSSSGAISEYTPYLLFGSPSWLGDKVPAWPSMVMPPRYLLEEIGDFDGDGNDDLLMMGPEQSASFLELLKNGKAIIKHQPETILAFGNGREPLVPMTLGELGTAASVGDLDGDGCTDLVLADATTGILFGGDRNLEVLARATLDGITPVAARSLVGISERSGGMLVLGECSSKNMPKIRRWIAQDRKLKELQPLDAPMGSSCPMSLQNVGDIDGDGVSELASAQGLLSIARDSSTVKLRRVRWPGIESRTLPVGDVDGDGLDDLVVEEHDLENVDIKLHLYRGTRGGLPQLAKTFRHKW